MLEDSILSDIAKDERDPEDLSRDEIETTEAEISEAIDQLDEQIERMSELREALVVHQSQLERRLAIEDAAPEEPVELVDNFKQVLQSMNQAEGLGDMDTTDD